MIKIGVDRETTAKIQATRLWNEVKDMIATRNASTDAIIDKVLAFGDAREELMLARVLTRIEAMMQPVEEP